MNYILSTKLLRIASDASFPGRNTSRDRTPPGLVRRYEIRTHHIPVNVHFRERPAAAQPHGGRRWRTNGGLFVRVRDDPGRDLCSGGEA